MEEGSTATAFLSAECPLDARSIRSFALFEEEAPAVAPARASSWLQRCCRENPAVDTNALLEGEGTVTMRKPRCLSFRTCCLFVLLPVLALICLAVPLAAHLRSASRNFRLEGTVSIDVDQLDGNVEHVEGMLSSDSENFGQHLGSFCFGKELDGSRQEVGGIKITLFKHDRVTPWFHEGLLWFLFFDDENAHWGKAIHNWNSSSITDRVRAANRAIPIHLNMFPPAVQFLTAHIGITEQFVRHWHAVLAGKAFHAGLPIQYRIEATGALTSAGPGDWQPDECPTQPWVGVQNFLAKHLT